jgi:ribosomal protein L37AE/L43A
MKSIRKALRDGDLEKDTYERIVCANCEKSLGRRNEPSEIGDIRICPECGDEYKQLK